MHIFAVAYFTNKTRNSSRNALVKINRQNYTHYWWYKKKKREQHFLNYTEYTMTGETSYHLTNPHGFLIRVTVVSCDPVVSLVFCPLTSSYLTCGLPCPNESPLSLEIRVYGLCFPSQFEFLSRVGCGVATKRKGVDFCRGRRVRGRWS